MGKKARLPVWIDTMTAGEIMAEFEVAYHDVCDWFGEGEIRVVSSRLRFGRSKFDWLINALALGRPVYQHIVGDVDSVTASNLAGRVIKGEWQHELDHLDGHEVKFDKW